MWVVYCSCSRHAKATPEIKRFPGPRGARSDRTGAVMNVDLLPHHSPADAEEVPQVAQDSAVKRAVLAVTVLQVGDPVTWHELPGGAVDGHQVEVAAQQQHDHHGENANDDQTRQKETVTPEPQIPGDTGRESGPAKQTSASPSVPWNVERGLPWANTPIYNDTGQTYRAMWTAQSRASSCTSK